MIRLLIKKCDQRAIYSAWHNQHPLIGVRPQLWNYRPAFRLWQILVAIDESVTTRRPLVLSTIFLILFHASGETLLTAPFCWNKIEICSPEKCNSVFRGWQTTPLFLFEIFSGWPRLFWENYFSHQFWSTWLASKALCLWMHISLLTYEN